MREGWLAIGREREVYGDGRVGGASYCWTQCAVVVEAHDGDGMGWVGIEEMREREIPRARASGLLILVAVIVF